jgi:fumarate reductase subunit C
VDGQAGGGEIVVSSLTRTAPYTIKPTWWLTKLNYFIFMMRELSAVFIALFLLQFIRVPSGVLVHPELWGTVTDWFNQPAVIAFNVVALAFAILHTVTFFQAGAVIMPLKIAGKKVPTMALVAGNLGAWLGFSVVLIWLLVKF